MKIWLDGVTVHYREAQYFYDSILYNYDTDLVCYVATVLIANKAGLERWLGLYCPYIGIAGVTLYIRVYASHPRTHMYMGNSHICWPVWSG